MTPRIEKISSVLVLDVGGSHVKCIATGQKAPIEFISGQRMTPARMMKNILKVTSGWQFDAVSIGYPGVVRRGRIVRDPRNLGPGWIGFDFEAAFGCPVKIINDAAMQALGSYEGGKMLFLGLGTGLGSALIVDGVIAAMELGHLHSGGGHDYEYFLGEKGRKRMGNKKWRRKVEEVVDGFREALLPDYIVLGGGDVAHLKRLPPQTRRGDNAYAFLGGFRLWERHNKNAEGAVGTGWNIADEGCWHDSPANPPAGGVYTATGDGKMALNDVVFLLDCDNTLLDNDRVQDDLRMHLASEFGPECRDRYWGILEALRAELGYVDYLGALQRYRLGAPGDSHVLQMSEFLVDYPFADRLYPGALDAIAHLRAWGPTVVLSDGDVVFQPRKVERSGLWNAVEGRVLIYIHKEQMLDDLERHYPARHYVMVDDKLRILAAMKEVMGDRLTTVFPRQGHYALDPDNLAAYPPADVTIERIADLLNFDYPASLGPTKADDQRGESNTPGAVRA
jgi:polyphosphate glucokinase